jgi:hypothetical protein
MMIYLPVFSNASIKCRESAGNPNLRIKRHIGDSVTHYCAFVTSRHLRTFACRCGVVKEVVVRKQIVKEAGIAGLFCSQHKDII